MFCPAKKKCWLFHLAALAPVVFCSLILALVLGTGPSGAQEKTESAPAPVHLMITQIVAHPALDAVRQGALDELKVQGYHLGDSLKVTHENAQGNISTAVQIAQKFAGEKPTAVLALSTPSAQTVLSAVGQDIPVVFGAITDPLAAKLVASLDKPGANVTGVTDQAPIQDQFQFIVSLMTPQKVKKMGVLYNPGEANSQASLAEIRRHAKELKIQIVESAAIRSAEVGTSAQKVIDQVDVIYIPPDNTIVSGLEPVIHLGRKHKVPVFAADVMLVERGLAPMIGLDYYETGRQAGKLLARIFNGEKPGDLPVESPQKLVLKVNLEGAKAMGLSLPADLLKKAEETQGLSPSTSSSPKKPKS